MNRSLVASVTAGVLGGLANVMVTRELLERVDSPFFEPGRETALNPGTIGSVADAPHVWLGVFALGFVPLFATTATRLLAPGGGFVALLVGVVHTVLTAPFPEGTPMAWGTLVEGPFYASNYAKSWYAWLSLLLVAGVAEFALRRGYGLGDERLRNLPTLPLSRSQLRAVVLGSGLLVGLGIGLLSSTGAYYQSDIWTVLTILVPGCIVTAIAIAALLTRGLVTPMVLYAYWTAGTVESTVFPPHPAPEYHTHPEVLFLFLSVALPLLACLEWVLRSRVRGWDGGVFAGRADTAE
ncbi:hypothetical protein C477_15320 [Haloterrigena salina JCM 13891]|uniref:Uncharacterized protein n=1 Tax=Haloterrigena salina JCM 13891 TaxID=1227488 RepID=M0C3B7_9EURY|nr:hypothetical protein [Haloterrigena salina]ELZ16414.1 hypothetical protein C477_15320 [Haloterrigena salina JCM 13891]